MSEITRRGFLKATTGAAGACALGAPLMAALGSGGSKKVDRTTIYTVFLPTAPSRDDTTLEPVPNQQIAQQLRQACGGVEFVVRDFTQGARLDQVLNEMKDLKNQRYDGVIICGSPRARDLLRSGLPTINAAVINDFMNAPYPLFKQYRTVPAFLDPWRFSSDPKVPEQMFRDLVEKIKLIQMLKRMKSEHILTVTDSEYVNVTYGDLRANMPEHYNQEILGAIDETFGTRVTKIGTKEVTGDKDIQKLWQEDSHEANEIARCWIRNAKAMMNTIESEVVRSAKVYLAMKMLMEKYDATAMAYHIRTLVANPRPTDYVTPALATSEFQLENIVAKCQSHLNMILSEMLLQYAYRRPSMLGDYSVDTYNNTSMVQHCEGPWNAWGDDRRVPYYLVDHRERPIRQRATTGVSAASWILYPPNETVTLWQIDVQSKEILMHTGSTVPMLYGAKRYRDHFYEMM